MALPKKVNDKVAALALREAAKDVDEDVEMGNGKFKMKMDEPDLVCPKCGYHGLLDEFKPAGSDDEEVA